MFRKGSIVRKINDDSDELFVVVKTNVPIIHGYNTYDKPMYKKSKLHMYIKPVGDENHPGESMVLCSEYEEVMSGKKNIKPFKFI